MERIVTVSRAGGALVLLVSLAGAAGWLSRTTAATTHRVWSSAVPAFDDLVLLCALGILTVAACWLTLATTLTAATEALRCTHGALGRLAARITPRLCRVLVRALCGAVVLSVPVTLSASAAPVDPAPPLSAGCAAPRCAHPLGDLPMPDRVSGHQVPETDARLTVRPGDTLWAIATRHLHSTASGREIAAAWPVWFRVNRARLGSDPDLIHPRTRLLVPTRFRPEQKDLR
ncbi:MAG: LysM peptidoglycan-binding domain-containing protein [Nocardioidaceae bacterium]